MDITVTVRIEEGGKLVATAQKFITIGKEDADGVSHLARQAVFDAFDTRAQTIRAKGRAEEADPPEFPTYVGYDGKEHAEY